MIERAVNKWGAEIIEFHLDLDGSGEEFNKGHCWLPDRVGKLISNINNGILSDGNGIKEPTISELPDRLWRTDPIDGLRPFKNIRDEWNASN